MHACACAYMRAYVCACVRACVHVCALMIDRLFHPLTRRRPHRSGGAAPGNMLSRMSAIVSLGLAYAGNPRPAVRELLIPIITDDSQPMDVIGHAALSLGLIHAGTAHDEAVQTLLQVFMLRGKEFNVKKLSSRLCCIGLALLFIRKGDEADAVLEVVKTFDPSISRYCMIILQALAYAATGNVLMVRPREGERAFTHAHTQARRHARFPFLSLPIPLLTRIITRHSFLSHLSFPFLFFSFRFVSGSTNAGAHLRSVPGANLLGGRGGGKGRKGRGREGRSRHGRGCRDRRGGPHGCG